MTKATCPIWSPDLCLDLTPHTGFATEFVGGPILSQLRPEVRAAATEGEDGSAGCMRLGRGVGVGRVPAGASLVRCPAPRARPARGARRAGPHADALHRAEAGGFRRGRRKGSAVASSPCRCPARRRAEVAPWLAVLRQVTQQVSYSDERIATLTQTDARVGGRRACRTSVP
jgi:hypothetical protein